MILCCACATQACNRCMGDICECRHKDKRGSMKNSFLMFALVGLVSWYSSADCCGPKTNHNPGCPLADQESIYELEKAGETWIASNNFPLGTKVRVTNLDNGKAISTTVRDRGGFKKYKRIGDLSKAGFQRLAPLSKGVLRVKIEKINS